ncbi:MAG: hypothetical protein ABUL44_02155, partial [Flavobacterium sp.]
MNRNFIFFASGLFLCCNLFGDALTGQAKLDSLYNALNHSKPDTLRVNTLNEIAFETRIENPDTSLFFSKKSFELASQLNYSKGIIVSKMWKGAALSELEEDDAALQILDDAIRMCDSVIAATNTTQKKTFSLLKTKVCSVAGIALYVQGKFE